jgi:hypothetical protein
MSDESSRLWDAVDSITKPTTHKVVRGPLEWLEDGRGSFCRVTDFDMATLAYGKVPCLWAEANWAVYGSEAGDGSGGRSPLRERTPADVDLMETLLTIRESLGWQLPGRSVRWRKPGNIPDMMRQFAAHIVTHEPQHVEWWAFRFGQWARLLHNHLNALDNGPKPMHIRGASCPLCRCGQVFVTEHPDGGRTYEPANDFRKDSDRKVEPALRIDFSGGYSRCVTCLACGHAWFRGVEMEGLANVLKGA